MPRTRSIRWSELKLGITGLVAFALATALILAVGGQGGFFWQRYPLQTRFPDVGGLKTGAIVRLNGMEVGKVTRVELAGPEVEIGMEVSKDVRALITSDSEASMGTLSLLGEPIVNIRAADTGSPLPDGGFVKPVRGSGVAELATTASRSLENAGDLLADLRHGRGTMGRLFTDDALGLELERLVGSAARVASHLDEGRGSLGALANDRAAYESLLAALEDLESLASRLDHDLGEGRGPIGRLLGDEAMGGSLAQASGNLEEISGRLARGEGTAGRLLTDEELYLRLSDLTGRMDRLLAGLETGTGTAGQLVRDPELYRNVTAATSELRELIADVRRDPRKYLTVDFRIF